MFLSLKIISINKNNEYVLQSEKSKKRYTLMLEFYDVEKPQIGDRLLISKTLLDKNSQLFCQPYAFAAADKSVIDNFAQNYSNDDIVVLSNLNKNIILQRIYG